jgi:hypothetical protein
VLVEAVQGVSTQQLLVQMEHLILAVAVAVVRINL